MLESARVPLPYRTTVIEAELESFVPPDEELAVQEFIDDSHGVITVFGQTWGKSRIAAYILVVAAKRQIARNLHPHYLFVQGTALFREIRGARRTRNDRVVEVASKTMPLLVLDDVDKITRWDMPVFREVLVRRVDNGHVTILTAENLDFLNRTDVQVKRRVMAGRQIMLTKPPLPGLAV